MATPFAVTPARPSPTAVTAAVTAALAVGVAALVSPAGAIVGVAALAAPVLVIAAFAGRQDSVSVLSAYAFALLLPSSLGLFNLGGLFTPVTIVGVGVTWWWALGTISPPTHWGTGPQPIRRATVVFGLSILASYAVASQRALLPVEARAADRGLLVVLSLVGVCMLAADGVGRRHRLEILLRRMTVIGAVMAAVGVIQFAFDYDPTRFLSLPGLAPVDTGYEAITTRSEFNRVAGTTLHPIEFSVVLTMLVPLAIHFAWRTPRRLRGWIPVALMGAAIPMSVSRTGTLGLAVVAAILLPSWTSGRRRQAIVVGAGFLLVMRAVVPGLLGTLRALFFSFWVDPSVASRQQDYGYIGAFIAERPVFGRGFATFLPDLHDFLDNQYLLSLVETGIVGAVALAGLWLTAIGAARAVRRRSTDATTRDLAQALVAAAAVPLVSCATFDFLSFPTARGVAFLVVGAIAALWRLEQAR